MLSSHFLNNVSGGRCTGAISEGAQSQKQIVSSVPQGVHAASPHVVYVVDGGLRLNEFLKYQPPIFNETGKNDNPQTFVDVCNVFFGYCIALVRDMWS